jgi:predicted dehydrogenase
MTIRSSDPLTRRAFVATATAAAASAISPRAASSYARVRGANDRLRLGVIGAGGRGRYVMELLQGADVDAVALCDVFEGSLQEARARVTGPSPRLHRDHREVLDASDVDVVVIATPDHWHAPMAVDACRAGKDVYLEKPLAHTIDEGRAIVEAAEQTGRIVQVGLQQRSGSHYQEAKARYFDPGRIGRIGHVRTWWHGQNPRLLDPARDRRPPGLDWERFVGPASPRPFDPRQFYQWRNYAAFGEGQVGDLFTHWVDVVQWFMGDGLPKAASAMGGIYHFPDGRDWPDTVSVLVEYPGSWTCSFEASLAPGARGLGVEFLGTEGRLYIDRNRYTFTANSGETETGGVEHDITRDHVRNFVASVRARTVPNAPVLTSHRSTLISHLANLAYLRSSPVELGQAGQGVL